MRRMIRKVEGLTVAALALVGAWKVASWLCAGTAWLLVNHGCWEPAEAASAAPWILLALGSGLFMSLYGMYEDNCRYTRSSPYGRIENSRSRKDESRRAG